MTDGPKQKPQKAAPATGKKGKAQKPKVKRVRKLGVFSFLFLFILIIALITLMPTYSIILTLLPEQYKHVLLKNIHQTIVLDKSGKELSEPFKYDPDEPLPVLGINTGLCFSFSSGENSAPNKQALKKATQNQEIAEIIIIGNNKYEYSLKTTTIEETTDSSDKNVSNICQTFGRDYPVIPKTINVIYIRPLEPFTPIKVMWATTRDIRQN